MFSATWAGSTWRSRPSTHVVEVGMEQLKKLCDALGEEVAATRDDSTDAERKSRFGDRDKFLRLALAPKPKSVANDRKPSADDLATTLDIVQRASEAMRVSEERTSALETRI